MDADLRHASLWEQQLYRHFVEHVSSEQRVIQRYRDAAEHASSPAFAYLAMLILEDEQRHHKLMQELAESIRKFAELGGDEEPVPPLYRPKDREALVELTEELLTIEKADKKELAALRKELKDVATTTLWGLMVDLMERDTDKHIHILEFARSWLRG